LGCFGLYVVVGCGLEDDKAQKIAQSSSSSPGCLIEVGAVDSIPSSSTSSTTTLLIECSEGLTLADKSLDLPIAKLVKLNL
jgi:hypothetical protein